MIGRLKMSKDTNQIDQIIGRRIREKRSQLGLSIEQVAQQLEISREQLDDFESGQQRVGARRLLALAQCLGVPTSYFFASIAPDLKIVSDNGVPLSDKAEGLHAFDDGLRLLRAFSNIKNPALRDLVIRLTNVVAKIEKTQEDER